MDSKYWQYIDRIRTYLDSKKPAGIEGMKKLFGQISTEVIDFIVIAFTYENLEVYIKKGDKWQLNNDLSNSLNRYEIEDITDFECKNDYEDFQSYQIISIRSELIKSWVVDCFYSAGGTGINTKFYFKEQHDQMEILALNTLEDFYEASEFETFIKNGQHRLLQLIPT